MSSVLMLSFSTPNDSPLQLYIGTTVPQIGQQLLDINMVSPLYFAISIKKNSAKSLWSSFNSLTNVFNQGKSSIGFSESQAAIIGRSKSSPVQHTRLNKQISKIMFFITTTFYIDVRFVKGLLCVYFQIFMQKRCYKHLF